MREQVIEILQKLWDVFIEEDATLVEVNPLVKTPDRQGRRARRQGLARRERRASVTPTTRRWSTTPRPTRSSCAAKEKDLNYVKLAGEVGIIGNGAGLVMSTLDVVAYAGEEFGGQKPANFLDIGGGASAQVMADGLEIILGDPRSRRCSSTSSAASPPATRSPTASCRRSQLLADKGEAVTKPLVVRLDGNNADLGRQILPDAANPLVELVDTMDGAARRVAELAAQGA